MQKISPYALSQNAFDLIGKRWAMITTRRGEKVNTMTASWGGVGVLWNKPVAFLFIRPQRFTRELLDDSTDFSVCFLPEEQRPAMGHCGKATGRDGDKLADCGLHTEELDGFPVLKESNLTFLCKKLYRQQMTPESFLDKSLIDTCYPNADYHYLYVAEIVSAYQE